MAAVTFDVDIVLKLVDKTVEAALGNVENVTGKIAKNLSGAELQFAQGQDLARATQDTFKYAQQLQSIEQLYGRNSAQAKTFSASVVETGKATATSLNRARILLEQIDLRFLSLIFGGMALQRTFTNVFRGILEGYKQFTDKNDQFQKRLTKLNDSFLFLKFVIGQAFANSPLVQSAIDAIIGALDELAVFFNKNPDLGSFLVGLSIAMAGLGAIMFFAGNAFSVFSGAKAGVELLQILGNTSTIGGLGRLSIVMAVVAVLIAVVAAAIIAFPALRKEVGESFESLSPIMKLAGEDLDLIAQKVFGLSGFYELLSVSFQGLISGIISRTLLAVGAFSLFFSTTFRGFQLQLKFIENVAEGMYSLGQLLTRQITFKEFTSGIKEGRDELKTMRKEFTSELLPSFQSLGGLFKDSFAPTLEIVKSNEQIQAAEVSDQNTQSVSDYNKFIEDIKVSADSFIDTNGLLIDSQSILSEALNGTSTNMDVLNEKLGTDLPSSAQLTDTSLQNTRGELGSLKDSADETSDSIQRLIDQLFALQAAQSGVSYGGGRITPTN